MMNTTPLERIRLLSDLRDKYYRHRGVIEGCLPSYVCDTQAFLHFLNLVENLGIQILKNVMNHICCAVR